MPGTDIAALKANVTQELSLIHSLADLAVLRQKILGRKGIVASLTAAIPQLPAEGRSDFGKEINGLKAYLTQCFDEKEAVLSQSPSGAQGQSALENFDLPGIMFPVGRLHPLTQTLSEICVIFERMGFSVVEGPEIETEYNNFTGLNIPLDHPSRDAFDTFYLTQKSKQAERLLLRSHTSPVQIRAMKARKPPFAVVVPGRVYRPDATDASHSCMFHQVEGFVVDTRITFADLKGTLETFAQAVFGQDIRMRFRPHFFPFTEPSAEVDISCIICKGKGCSVCGRKGWLEILGSGMIHPKVLKNCGHDPKKYSGFAFGLGIERIAMLKHGINDIRLFFENDLRFLRQW